MTRQMFRYEVPVDDQAHKFALTGNPVAVAVRQTGPLDFTVEFWAEHDDDSGIRRAFQVFGTGHPLPDGARWTGTCPRTAGGLVFHLYELTEATP
jgi:hypothetical protein